MNSHTLHGLSPEASKLFRVRRTVLKMLRKRGYNVPDEHINLKAEDFKQKFGEEPAREMMTILVEKEDEVNNQLFVFFPTDEKVGVKPIKTYCSRMKEQNVRNAIIVVRSNLTPFSKSAIRELAQRGYRIEYFRDAEMLVDITEHKLVPEHTLLSQTEKESLLSRYSLKPSQLPRIQVHDPVARYLGLKQGDVVKIIRPSETAGRYVTYRICI